MALSHENLTPLSASVPTTESAELFRSRPDAQFAVGMVAVNGAIINGYQHLFDGATQLRAGTYLEKGFVTESELDANGTELDTDDERAAHFTVVERLSVNGLVRIVANMRLVIKEDEQDALPVERFFPEVFDKSPLPNGSFEVSRLISKHEDPATRSLLKWPLFIAGLKYADNQELGPAYGLMTPALTRSLRTQRVPVRPIAPAKRIREIHATKQPVEIDMDKLRNVVQLTGDLGIDVNGQDFSYLDFSDTANVEEAV